MSGMEEPTLEPSFENGVIGIEDVHWPSATVYILKGGVELGVPEAIAEWNRRMEEANGSV